MNNESQILFPTSELFPPSYGKTVSREKFTQRRMRKAHAGRSDQPVVTSSIQRVLVFSSDVSVDCSTVFLEEGTLSSNISLPYGFFSLGTTTCST